jgi:hypothetical protein
VTGSSATQADAAALETAHFFGNRLLRGSGGKLCKRDHFAGKDRFFRLEKLLGAGAGQCPRGSGRFISRRCVGRTG